ncbi:MAG: type I-B CRISPR-associated protein Cas5b [Candidatus Methanoperedens sp.]|nr:type I-B CRISPR-associated protein Cas5b [Candidatus Methanoperedens sp.]MCZ7403551.1 type I-B CRISPR-associated protein Cas5b [Candidatus Methanoperedens sp.]
MTNILIFDLKGPFAHFRKYFTNSSSLSYSFPPRTVITGLVAGLLGYERDTYYKKFGDSECKVAVSIKTPIRKIMQTMNYTNTKSYTMDSILSGKMEHTPIPLEIVRPLNNYDIVYRIYFQHEKIHQEFKERLEQQKFFYPPYLGITEFLAEIEFIDVGELSDPQKNTDAILNCVCRKNAIKDRGLKFEDDNSQYLIEKMPADFSENRDITRLEQYIFEKSGKDLNVSLNEPFYKVTYKKNTDNITFM